MAKREFKWLHPQQTQLVVNGLRNLKPGKRYRLEIVEDRPRRSDRQNRYYWPCIVVPFAEWLTEQYGETKTQETAHEVLKDTFLRTPICDELGDVPFDVMGNPPMRTRSTTELDTGEFAKYVDDCRQLLHDLCKIETFDPDPDYDLKPKRVTHKRIASSEHQPN
jgi:hypothetical protein